MFVQTRLQNNLWHYQPSFWHTLYQLSWTALYIVIIIILSELHILHQYCMIRTYLVIWSRNLPNTTYITAVLVLCLTLSNCLIIVKWMSFNSLDFVYPRFNWLKLTLSRVFTIFGDMCTICQQQHSDIRKLIWKNAFIVKWFMWLILPRAQYQHDCNQFIEVIGVPVLSTYNIICHR